MHTRILHTIVSRYPSVMDRHRVGAVSDPKLTFDFDAESGSYRTLKNQ
jgi:hypothetical protein